jgi:WD40 repeat protein
MGSIIVSGSDDRTVHLWDADSGAPLGKPLKGHTGSVRSVAFSPDGKHIVSGSFDSTVRLWDAEHGAPLGEPLKGYTGLVTSVAFSTDGRHIVLGSQDSNMCSQDALQLAHSNTEPSQSDLPLSYCSIPIKVSSNFFYRIPVFTLFYFSLRSLMFLLFGLFRKAGSCLTPENCSSGCLMDTELDSGCL